VEEGRAALGRLEPDAVLAEAATQDEEEGGVLGLKEVPTQEISTAARNQ